MKTKNNVILRPEAVPQGLHLMDHVGSTRGAEESSVRSFGPVGLRMTVWFLLCLALTSSTVFAMGRKPKVVPIKIKVDFGPANKPGYSGALNIEKGTTPKEAVSQVFPVLSGFACCSLREIIAIDGVKIDPAKNHWWTVSVNGSKKVKPNRTKLKKGDVLEWKYIQEAQ